MPLVDICNIDAFDHVCVPTNTLIRGFSQPSVLLHRLTQGLTADICYLPSSCHSPHVPVSPWHGFSYPSVLFITQTKFQFSTVTVTYWFLSQQFTILSFTGNYHAVSKLLHCTQWPSITWLSVCLVSLSKKRKQRHTGCQHVFPI